MPTVVAQGWRLEGHRESCKYLWDVSFIAYVEVGLKNPSRGRDWVRKAPPGRGRRLVPPDGRTGGDSSGPGNAGLAAGGRAGVSPAWQERLQGL